MTNKKTEKKQSRVSELLGELKEEVENFNNSEAWANYLKFSRKFINRSFNNQMLIYLYAKETNLVMGYKQWIDKFDRIPVACCDCRAIKVKECNCVDRIPPVRIPQLAPMTKKIEDDNGEEEEILFFRAVEVFAIEDTEALSENAPDIEEVLKQAMPIRLLGAMENADQILENLTTIAENNKFTVRYDTWESKTLNGWCDYSNKEIVVAQDRDPNQQIKTLIHEIGHMFSHAPEEMGNIRDPRALVETEAESIAFVVGDFIGLDTSDYSIGYINSWSEADTMTLEKSTKRVMKTSTRILNELEKLQEVKT